MASRQAQKRLNKEYKALTANPPPLVMGKPNEENILEWHYVITGPPNTPFEGGQYHGVLRFPKEYPFKPPSISMLTPNGRFACNTRLCLSISDYHPDTWNPAWSVSTILTGLLSFMTGDESTTGSITTSDSVKKRLARDSKEWNITENPRFKRQFPELTDQNKIDVREAKLKKEAEMAATQSREPEKPINLKDQMELLDPEDRARLLVDDEAEGTSFLLQRFTLFGVVVAAFIAAYFSFLRHG
ncbi:uncharacterized protein PRCAT00005231001 [Priceomyces carsonii]|uniref:uncharacterized protein n=1 Tax=Priceomyces carsonii TaxID=28549 RepID=UPI002ED7F155|nr:unnamed protein product [Priceomyces carsonii]